MIKSTVEEKIKESSIAIMVISVIASLFSGAAGIYGLLNEVGAAADAFSKKMMLKSYISDITVSVILIIAAAVFFRIFRSGRPFTKGNIKLVRLIALMFLINAVLPSVIMGTALGFAKTSIIGAGSLFNAMLFFFFAEIMRYGNLLQTESDETL